MTKEEYIRKYNLIATKSIKDLNTLYTRDFNVFNYNINYDKSLNIYNILDDFNSLHHEILYNYLLIDKINIAKDMDIFSYSKDCDYELLQFLLRHPDLDIYNKSSIAFLNLYNVDDFYYAKLVSSNKKDDSKYEEISVFIDPIIIKEYIDLGCKYSKLITSYRELKKYFGKSYFEGEINLGLMLDGDLLSKINYYKLSFGLDKVDFIITFDDILNVVKIERKNPKINFTDQEVIEIAKSLYIRKKIVKNIIPKDKIKEKQLKIGG